MKVCIIGAGAIGGFIGTRLAVAGRAELSALARGATLAALREHGWRTESGGTLMQADARATDNPAELGPQDLIIIAVKGPALTAVAQGITPLLAPHTMVMPAMNGVPWWFCDAVQGIAAAPLQSVDPGGVVARSIAMSRVVGCVVHASAAAPEPGFVQHRMGKGLIVGEPAGGKSERVQRIAELLVHAGFDVTHSGNIRYDIWYKLWGNLTMNPVSAITGASIDRVLADPLVREYCSAAMREAAAIGARIGCPIEETPADRHAVTAKLGAFKSSMLQDVEAGRTIELDAIVGAVLEIAQRLGVDAPNIGALFGLTRLFGRVRGLYAQAQN
ncbi:MAG: 2-dehydropantoate 2-reductase [Burkholderiaceae bacterium]